MPRRKSEIVPGIEILERFVLIGRSGSNRPVVVRYRELSLIRARLGHRKSGPWLAFLSVAARGQKKCENCWNQQATAIHTSHKVIPGSFRSDNRAAKYSKTSRLRPTLNLLSDPINGGVEALTLSRLQAQQAGAQACAAGVHSLPGRISQNPMRPEEFEAVVQQALDHLPDWVHEALEHIQIVLEDAPGPGLEEEGENLLGLYVGVPLTERSVEDAGELPDIIYLFRRPHLEMGLTPDELREEIAKTLVHEIAHYFGIEDDHLEDIGWG
jgi:predicted Zn-dependent protease with MMP-like domain